MSFEAEGILQLSCARSELTRTGDSCVLFQPSEHAIRQGAGQKCLPCVAAVQLHKVLL